MMNKDKLSFADVEQLLTELAHEDAQTELMRNAARGEIRRVFRRRRCLQAAGHVAAIGAMGTALALLLPEGGEERALATSTAPVMQATPAPSATHCKSESKTTPRRGFDCSTDTCEVVIYSVPL